MDPLGSWRSWVRYARLSSARVHGRWLPNKITDKFLDNKIDQDYDKYPFPSLYVTRTHTWHCLFTFFFQSFPPFLPASRTFSHDTFPGSIFAQASTGSLKSYRTTAVLRPLLPARLIHVADRVPFGRSLGHPIKLPSIVSRKPLSLIVLDSISDLVKTGSHGNRGRDSKRILRGR